MTINDDDDDANLEVALDVVAKRPSQKSCVLV